MTHKNRKVRKAEKQGNYTRASYYFALHLQRKAAWALREIETTRGPINFSSSHISI